MKREYASIVALVEFSINSDDFIPSTDIPVASPLKASRISTNLDRKLITLSLEICISLFTGGIQWKDAYVAVGNKLRNGEKINSHDPVPMLSDSPELSGELRKAIQTKMNYRNEARDQVIAIARQYFLAQNRQM